MTKMNTLSQLRDIISNYDAFILDLWGVVHDGSHLYPGIQEVLSNLKTADKKVIFLSNAPRRAVKAAAVLEQLGIARDWYEQVMTSGEAGYGWLSQFSPSPRKGEGRDGGQMQPPPPLLNPPPFRGRKYYYIGPGKDADVLDGLDFARVDDLKQADFLLNVGFGSEEQSTQDLAPLLRAARAQNLPMLCLNPDLEVIKITGERFACAGVIAHQYEDLGGTVTWFGKPYPAVYEHCLSALQPIPKERILAVGDSLGTDIRGAQNMGIDAMLITGGILKDASQAEIESRCKKESLTPRYIAQRLEW